MAAEEGRINFLQGFCSWTTIHDQVDGLLACTDNIKWTIWLLEKEHMKLGDKSGAKNRGEIGAEGMWEHFITIHCMHM